MLMLSKSLYSTARFVLPSRFKLGPDHILIQIPSLKPDGSPGNRQGGGGGGGGTWHQMNMDSAVREEAEETNTRELMPNLPAFHRLLHSHPQGGWDKCWEEGVTPWDLGKPTPIIEHLQQTGSLPEGRALVPGCGTGYDVTAIACPERYVIGLDISDVAIKKAVEVSSSLPNAKYFTFLKEDFFTWQPSELFDLIFDYTFFCAIYPEMRSAWAQRIAELLKPDGELITLMFPINDHAGGPPYKVSVSDYEEVLSPMGFEATSIVDNDLAVGPRQGREKLGRWKRLSTQSAL